MAQKATPGIDWRGVAYHEGDTVLYSTAHGRAHQIVEAVVLEVGDRSVLLQPVADSQRRGRAGRPVRLTMVQNITAMPFGF